MSRQLAIAAAFSVSAMAAFALMGGASHLPSVFPFVSSHPAAAMAQDGMTEVSGASSVRKPASPET